MIHKRIFKVVHPTYGFITVGSECFKDVMGYSFGKAHEKATETYDVLQKWARENIPGIEADFRREGKVVAFGLPKEQSGCKSFSSMIAYHIDSNGYEHFSFVYGVGKRPRLPHGWSATITTAGLDLNLWCLEKEHPTLQACPFSRSSKYTMDVADAK